MLTRAIAPRGRSWYLALAAVTLTAILALSMSLNRAIPLSNTVQAPSVSKMGRLPLAFVPNNGQADPDVRFTAYGTTGGVEFTSSDVVFTLPSSNPSPTLKAPAAAAAGDLQARGTDGTNRDVSVVRLQFVGANTPLEPVGGESLPSKVNYYRGSDPAQWRAGLPTYGDISYSGLYPGTDLKYEGYDGQLKATYILAPGADPDLIRWRYAGAQSMSVDEAGNLKVRVGATTADAQSQELVEHAPIAWQEVNGRRVPVDVRYQIEGDTIGFALGSYDAAHPLVIDPTLTYSTYFGSDEIDEGNDIAVDPAGNMYVVGATRQDDDFGDVLVAKFSPNGQTLLFINILGGTRVDYADAVALDGAGNVYVAGAATSGNYPVVNALQPVNNGSYNAILTKLTSTGQIVYSTYLGGSTLEFATDIAVDAAGNVYMTGGANSVDFPTVNAFQPVYGGDGDGFSSKINPAGSALVYSTYVGGSYADTSNGITIDAAGHAYITGQTQSLNFPTANAFQPQIAGSDYDAFVTKLSPSGSALVFSTYLGGSGGSLPGVDNGHGIAVDSTGHVYVAGATEAPNFPTTEGSFQPFFRGYLDAFITKFTPDGQALVYSTYLGGTFSWPYGADKALDIVVDGVGSAYVAGNTNSPDFPLRNPIQGEINDLYDAFIAKFNPEGSDLVYSTFLGGDGVPPDFTGNDIANGIVIDAAGMAYLVGTTESYNFPVVNPYQFQSTGPPDLFIAKIFEAIPTATPTVTGTPPTATPTRTRTPTRTPLPTFQPSPTITPVVCGTATINGSITDNDLRSSSYIWWDEVASSCAAPKTCPEVGQGEHYYDLHRFVNTSSSDRCITVTLDGTDCGPSTGIFSMAYLGNFNPNNACANYLGDPGEPSDFFSGIRTYSFQVPAGATFVVIVQEMSEESGCDTYRVSVSGLDTCPATTPTPPATPSATSTATVSATRTATAPAGTPVVTRTPTAPASTSTVPVSTSTAPAGTPSSTRTVVSGTPTVTICAISFGDMPSGSTFYSEVLCLACRQIVSGYSDNTFRPNNLVTRGQLAKIVSNAAGFTENPGAQIFQDVAPDHTFYEWINRLTNRGYMSGYTCGSPGEPCVNNRPYFRPFANATRAQTSKIVSNAATYNDTPTEQSFEDVPPTHPFYVEIQRLASRNIMGGYNCGGAGEPCGPGNRPYFRPYNNVTRGQSAKIVANTFYPNCQSLTLP